MLHQDLTSLDSAPLDGGTKWLVPVLLAAAIGSGAVLFLLAGEMIFAGLFLAGFVAMLVAAFIAERRTTRSPTRPQAPVADLSLVGASLDLAGEAAVITDRDGRAIIANAAYRQRFATREGLPAPGGKTLDPALARLIPVALASGDAEGRLDGEEGVVRVTVSGASRDMLLWRFPSTQKPDLVTMAARRVAGATGERLAAGGVLAALVDPHGRLLAVNSSFAERALPGNGRRGEESARFDQLVTPVDGGGVRLNADAGTGPVYRLLQIPLDPGGDDAATTMMLVEGGEGSAQANSSTVQALLDILPIGLALVDRDGRFLTMNKAFKVAGGLDPAVPPTYPGDLVTKEDKAAVAEAVRRNARGPAMSGDLPVRLKHNPTEPVALTVAGLRGLGDAVVLLLLKDNSEEAKLKRQVAQATKMQAVGQLAGGVAHDFNNILTAIIGHCDLMLMRHTPGDSDYDDIQQIKSNSNRAAGLTRQLLAFSRQQTLRPQTLQLPDVVSEVSHLLKRLLGETVQLVVKHGRGVGPVRADPGQLEQVIVNLAVNGRDAMASGGGGTLTIQTYAVRADQVADLGSDILPVADYSALAISDTGVGIAPSVLGKVFEPFFTTKEVGKGTGLGLSTVYGIVKQSGGFIFADSRVGEGTRFTIYLPVHQVEEGKPAATPQRSKSAEDKELWGTGTVLLVEDEPMVRTVAERALTRHGYKVLTANNGEEALDVLAQDHDIALLISDVVMPMMDGPTMVREARKTHPHVPILFMSGYAEEQLRKSIDIDNVAFLPKPFAVQELAEAVRTVLARHAAATK